MSDGPTSTRMRREPPRFRRVAVDRVERLTPRLARVVLAGPELEGLTVDEPAASVRLLIPAPGESELVMPEWSGNEFLLADGSRPVIRTFTPHRLDAEALELDLWIVVHGHGAASQWAESARPGDPAAVSGTGRGYAVDATAPAFLLAGDETAIPAMHQLLETLPASARVEAHVEVGDGDAELALPEHPKASVSWHVLRHGTPHGDALVDAVAAADLEDGARVWAAGEASAMFRIRRHLFEEKGVPRRHATVRGYWKHGRGGDGDDP